MTTPNSFVTLSQINVNDHVEKKGGLSYLSWVWAVDELLRADPDASWEYRDFNGAPYFTLPDTTAMVFCTVTAFGKPRTMQLPVMDYKNRAIPNPDSFAVNTSMQRCLVKAISLHGIGLYIYAGENVPEGEDAPEAPKAAAPSGIKTPRAKDAPASTAKAADTSGPASPGLIKMFKAAAEAKGVLDKVEAALAKRGDKATKEWVAGQLKRLNATAEREPGSEG